MSLHGPFRTLAAAAAVAAAALAVGGSHAAQQEAVLVQGDGSSFSGVAREDIERLTVLRLDGLEQEVEIAHDGTFAYAADTPDRAARSLTARSAAGAVLATMILTPAPVCGGAAGPCPATAAQPRPPSYAMLERAGNTHVARVDPRTLAPVGRTLALEGPRYGPARSPDGEQIALAVPNRAAVDLVDLARLKVAATLPLAEGERTRVRGLAWLRADRLLAVVQRMSAPYSRRVESRELVVVDPQARRVLRRTPLTNKLAVHGSAAAGGRLVLLLQPSNWKGSTVQLVVADADGAVRSRSLEVGRHRSALRGNVLVVEPSGRRAFVLVWALGLRGGRAIEVDLETLRPAVRTIRLAPGTRAGRVGASMLQAFAAGEGHIAATDVVGGRDGWPVGGVLLIDTRTWTARVLDAHARSFAYHDGKVFTFGRDNLVRLDAHGRATLPRGGIGIAAYDVSGRRLYHAYGERSFARLLFSGGYSHALPAGPRSRVVFEAGTGRGVATLPHLHPHRIELVSEPPRVSSQRPAAVGRDDLRAFDRPATAADRLPESVRRIFRLRDSRVLESREAARYRDLRGRLHRLFVLRGRDAKGVGETCHILVGAGGAGSGCSPSREFFGPGRRVAASSGRLMSGVVARDVDRVVIVGSRGRVHPVSLTKDGGFIWNCRAYNGCACVVAELRAYDRSGRLVTRQDWRSPSCRARKTWATAGTGALRRPRSSP